MYICTATQKECEGKPWMILNMERWDGLPGPVTLSSYLAYRSCLHRLPKSEDLILNKEDFNYLFPIVTDGCKTFNTDTDINQLSEEEYRIYQEELQSYLYEKQLEEESAESSDTDDTDDY